MANRKKLESLPPILQEFITYSEVVKNQSHATVYEYAVNLRLFFRYVMVGKKMVDGITVDDISGSSPEKNDELLSSIDISGLDKDFMKSVRLYDAYEFIVYSKNVRGNNELSRARKVSAIRSYFDYLTNKAEYLDVNPMTQLTPPSLKRKLPKYLTLDECQQLLSCVDGEFKERDYAILMLFMNCGLRLSELTSIDISDIKENTLTVTGKGNKQRVLYLNESCVDAINRYMKVRPRDGVKADSRDALFLSRLKKRISNPAVQLMVGRYMKMCGFDEKGYTVHTLRHTAATMMYQYGNADVLILKEILGHENLNTTNIYTHISNKSIQNALDNNPLNKVKKD